MISVNPNIYKQFESQSSTDDFTFVHTRTVPATGGHTETPGQLNFNSIPTSLAFEINSVPPQESLLTYHMQSDAWGNSAHFISKPGRFPHQRHTSLSSLGSSDSTASYVYNVPDYHSTVSDSCLANCAEFMSYDLANTQTDGCHQIAKSMGSAQDSSFTTLDCHSPDMAYIVSTTDPEKRIRATKDLLPAAEIHTHFGRPQTLNTTDSGRDNSPLNSVENDASKSHRRQNGYNNVPKLDRTMTDVYADELYNPEFAITSIAPSPPSVTSASASSEVFNQRINAANHQHLNATQSPVSTGSRARSPFRTDSPFSTSPARGLSMGSRASVAKPWKEQHIHDEQNIVGLDAPIEPETPETISPKDAILEFTESDTDGLQPLFPQDTSSIEMDSIPKALLAGQSNGTFVGSSLPNSLPGGEQFVYLPTQIPANVQLPQQYPFIAHSTINRESPPPRLCSSGASSLTSGATTPPAPCARPNKTGSDAGTYTCTYHGCSLRFETPSLLQKHKREGHRQPQAVNTQRIHDTGPTIASNMVDTQAGPHRCDRINPSTGKPCNTIFSRPYDLTRHEDTIHNARKQKVRCHLCAEEKTFSRADALTRHYRVCHPDMDLPGKTRRRPIA